MPSFKSTTLAVATIIAGVVRADYFIDPKSVSASDRAYWCQSEIATCPIICQQTPPGTTKVNTCNPETLNYGCVCGNGMQPNVSEYSLTIPYFTCTEWGNQCVKACGQNNNACADRCRADNPCGALNPSPPNKTLESAAASASAAAATASASAGTIYNGLDGNGGSGSSPNKPNAGAPGLEAGSFLGLFTLAAGVALGFGVML